MKIVAFYGYFSTTFGLYFTTISLGILLKFDFILFRNSETAQFMMKYFFKMEEMRFMKNHKKIYSSSVEEMKFY